MSLTTGTTPFTSTQQCFTAPAIFNDSVQLCAPYINALQTCPTVPYAPTLRANAANLTNMCMMSVWASDNNPIYTANYTSAAPPKIEANSSCHYPDVIPILQQACAFEYSQVNTECYNVDNTSLATPILQYTLCQSETMMQYWRCTVQKPYDEVAACVIESADKVNWVPPIQPYSGEFKCQNRTSLLITTGVSMFVTFFALIIFTWLVPPIWSRIKQFIKPSDPEKPPEEQKNVWEIEKSYTLRAHLVLKSVGTEVLVAYLTVLILQHTQAGGFNSLKVAFWDAIFIFVIRPRVAPLTGILGFFKGWSETGLADVFADNALSWVAGFKILLNYWKFYSTPPANPAAPASELKILAVGAILSSGPAVLTLLFFFGACMSRVNHKKSIWEGVVWFFSVPVGVAAFLAFLPILALIELCAMAFFAIRHKRRHESVAGSGKRELQWLEKPLTTERPLFRGIIYPLIVAISWVINIGNWIFFVTYLRLAGDTFCPGDTIQVEVLWVTLPLAMTGLFFAFRKATGNS